MASLPRVVIMTMHDISLQPRDKDKPGAAITPDSPLELAGTVKTYRYLDEEEVAAAEAGRGRRSRGKSGGSAEHAPEFDILIASAVTRVPARIALVLALAGCARGITSTPAMRRTSRSGSPKSRRARRRRWIRCR